MDDNTKLIQDIVAKVISEIGTKEDEEPSTMPGINLVLKKLAALHYGWSRFYTFPLAGFSLLVPPEELMYLRIQEFNNFPKNQSKKSLGLISLLPSPTPQACTN